MKQQKGELKLIVIDPRRTPAARKGIHIQIRPGTDVALALAMLNVIITEDLYDKEFVRDWTVGFDKLEEHVKDYTPERVEEITWVPAVDIRQIARLYATSKPACIIQGDAVLGPTDQQFAKFSCALPSSRQLLETLIFLVVGYTFRSILSLTSGFL